jgi:hypothetical protein
MQGAEFVTKSDVLQLESLSRFEASHGDGDRQMNGAESRMDATTEGKQANIFMRNSRQAQSYESR